MVFIFLAYFTLYNGLQFHPIKCILNKLLIYRKVSDSTEDFLRFCA